MSDTLSTIRLELHPPIAEIVFDRPDVKNAVSSLMIAEILRTLDTLAEDSETRTVILRGEGNAFCAGADLEELKAIQEATFEENVEASRALVGLFKGIYTFPKATIAAVHGHCVAGGCGIATACDLIVADETARFRYSEAAIGFVAAIVTVMLLRSVGEKHARELLLTARSVPAREARRIGLINEAVPAGEHVRRARALAEEIALNSTVSISLSKEVLAAIPTMALDEAFDFAADINAAGRLNEECREGIAAFLEKRAPSWREKVQRQLGERPDA